MRLPLLCTPLLVVVTSCSSPPKPPTVDESQRRPVNTAAAVELQACKGELQNTRILAAESMRVAESASATAARFAAQQQSLLTRAIAPATAINAYFSDRGRLFQADRGRRNGAVGDALGKRASSGLNISQSSTISLKRAVAGPAVGLGFGLVDF